MKSKKQVERFVTQAAYAKMRGFTKQYVNKLVREGAIVLKDRRVDMKQADRAVASRPRPERVARRRKKAEPNRQPARPRRRTSEPRGTVSATGSLTAARAEEMQYKAKLAKLDHDERVGLLVRKDEVLKGEQRKNENIRGKFGGMHITVRSQLVDGMSKAEIAELVRIEVSRRLDQLSKDPLGMLAEIASRPGPVVEVHVEPAIAGAVADLAAEATV